MNSTQPVAKRKIAVMGGTFDPIHYGHLVAAEAVRCELSADCVIFIPTGSPPHKKTRVTDAQARFAMTELAVASNPHFVASRMEIDRAGETYTVDTVRQLREQHPDAELFFITGADAVHQILTWRNADELLKLCCFVAVTRPGYDARELQAEVERLRGRFSSRLRLLAFSALAISSSDIRGRCCAGKSIRYLLPEPVEAFIDRHRLYQNDDIKRAVRDALSERRYRHTLGVHETALKLAQRYGVSCEKAAIAALLHDYAKEIPGEEKLALCETLGIAIDPLMRGQPDLTHSFLSAGLARERFGINDSEILDAIAYHTTGRSHMCALEKILYIADLTEPHRSPYSGLNELRRAAEEDLDGAMAMGLRRKIAYTEDKQKTVHPLSFEALDYYNTTIDKTGSKRGR